MIHKSSDNRLVSRKAISIGMSIVELPIMAFLGFFIGKSFDREIEGAVLGISIGFVLVLISIRSIIKSSYLKIS